MKQVTSNVYVEDQFSVPPICNGTQPSLAHCSPLEWVSSLKRIEGMEVDTVVPGHGEMCGLKEVAIFRQFIENCIEMTQSAIREGKDRDQVADSVSFEGLYPGELCRRAVHPGIAMQRRNVLRLYEMLSG